MVRSAWSGAGDADINVLVVDAKRGMNDETSAIIDELIKRNAHAVLAFNKIDMVDEERLEELKEEFENVFAFDAVFAFSAQSGDHITDFYQYLADNLPISPWYYPEDQMSDMPLKFLAAEIVREKLFLNLRQELPYALTVEPELWEHKPDGSIRAEMTIYVEREGHKTIIIGHNGAMIKKIGQSARKELEELLDERIHLFLFVKVRENWGNDPSHYSDWNLDFKA